MTPVKTQETCTHMYKAVLESNSWKFPLIEFLLFMHWRLSRKHAGERVSRYRYHSAQKIPINGNFQELLSRTALYTRGVELSLLPCSNHLNINDASSHTAPATLSSMPPSYTHVHRTSIPSYTHVHRPSMPSYTHVRRPSMPPYAIKHAIVSRARKLRQQRT